MLSCQCVVLQMGLSPPSLFLLAHFVPKREFSQLWFCLICFIPCCVLLSQPLVCLFTYFVVVGGGVLRALQEGFLEEVAFVKPSANVVSSRAKNLKTKPRKPKQAT